MPYMQSLLPSAFDPGYSSPPRPVSWTMPRNLTSVPAGGRLYVFVAAPSVTTYSSESASSAGALARSLAHLAECSSVLKQRREAIRDDLFEAFERAMLSVQTLNKLCRAFEREIEVGKHV